MTLIGLVGFGFEAERVINSLRIGALFQTIPNQQLFVDDRPGKFPCRVDTAIAADLQTQASFTRPFDGNGERHLSISNRVPVGNQIRTYR
jgi:hypothetical protein